MKYFLFAISLLALVSCGCERDVEVDTVVIGGGLMGSAAAWHLSQNNQQVLLLEQQDSIYTSGSSFGEARIARSSNRGNDMWSYLHNRSVQEAKDLIAFLNSKRADGHSIDEIYTTNPVTYVGRLAIYDKLYASLIRQNVIYDMASDPESGKDLYGVNLPENVLLQREYNDQSGTINPKKLIQKLHLAIRLHNNEVWYSHRIVSITPNNCCNLVVVENVKTGETKTIGAKKIITAAGPYTGNLLHEVAPYLDTLINPQRVFLAFLKIRDEVYGNLNPTQKEKLTSFYPVINSSKGTRDGSFFSMIEYKDQNGIPIIKIGGHFQRSKIKDMDDVWKQKLTAKEIKWSLESTLSYLELLDLPVTSEDLEFVKGYSCVYSLTKTEVPIVSNIIGENHKPNPNFVVLGGMSGVGAKGAMTYGLIAANTLLNKVTEEDDMYDQVRRELGYERLLNEVKYSKVD